MNLPTSVVITGIDRMEILDQALEAARTFRPMTAAAGATRCWRRRPLPRRRRLRAVQDLVDLRRDRKAPGLAGEEPEHVQQATQ